MPKGRKKMVGADKKKSAPITVHENNEPVAVYEKNEVAVVLKEFSMSGSNTYLLSNFYKDDVITDKSLIEKLVLWKAPIKLVDLNAVD